MEISTILYFTTYLIIYSFAGWVLESIAKTIEQRKLVNSGFMHGPFCPIYGFGAIIMIVGLSSLKEHTFFLFLAGFFLLSIWEYIVGVLLEKVFKTKYWDYSHLKFNIKGRVCLKNSVFWGGLGVIFIKVIHPFVEKYITIIPYHILLYVNMILGIAIIVDIIVSAIEVTNLDTAVFKINEIGENIKLKVVELKGLKEKTKLKTAIIEKTSIENIEKMIQELNIAQARLKLKIYKQTNRLKKAFPSMKSETITQFLNQKIDLKKLKENSKKKK